VMEGVQMLPKVASDVDAFAMFASEKVVDAAKMVLPLKVLLFESSVEEAAVTVMEPPALSVVPLTVPSEPVRRFVPIDVVAITLPLLWVQRTAREVAKRL